MISCEARSSSAARCSAAAARSAASCCWYSRSASSSCARRCWSQRPRATTFCCSACMRKCSLCCAACWESTASPRRCCSSMLWLYSWRCAAMSSGVVMPAVRREGCPGIVTVSPATTAQEPGGTRVEDGAWPRASTGAGTWARASAVPGACCGSGASSGDGLAAARPQAWPCAGARRTEPGTAGCGCSTVTAGATNVHAPAAGKTMGEGAPRPCLAESEWTDSGAGAELKCRGSAIAAGGVRPQAARASALWCPGSGSDAAGKTRLS
mmetsp:Transcript_60695/g.180780  ORF Transcript_60695/g.180780 Transcript_60695/m.180780 type:complete len:267 (+) Transcript_60695:432-1232(+)